MAKKNPQAIGFTETGTAAAVKEETRAEKKNLPSLPAQKRKTASSEAPEIVKNVAKALWNTTASVFAPELKKEEQPPQAAPTRKPVSEAAGRAFRTMMADRSDTELRLKQQAADQAEKEYQSFKENNPIPYEDHGIIPYNPLTTTIEGPKQDKESYEYKETQRLRERAESLRQSANTQEDNNNFKRYSREITVMQPKERDALDIVANYKGGMASPISSADFKAAKDTLAAAGYSVEEVNALVDTYKRIQNRESALKTEREAAQFADDHPVLGSLASAGGNIIGGVTGTLDVFGEAIGRSFGQGNTYHNLDPNLPGYQPGIYAGTARQTVAQNIEDGFTGKVGSVLYQAAMSGVDNLGRVAFGGGGAMVLAGASAFQSGVRETTMKGGTPMQSYAMGVAQAGLEILTEKVSIDNLLSTPTPKNITQLLKNAAVQGAVEMTEEEMNFAGTLIADAAIMGKNSDYNRAIQDLVASGMPFEQAKRQAQTDVVHQAMETAVQSFLSGSMSSGARGAFQLMAAKAAKSQPSTAVPVEGTQVQHQTISEMAAQDPYRAPTEAAQPADVTDPVTDAAPQEIPVQPQQEAQPTQPVQPEATAQPDNIETLKRDIRATFESLKPNNQVDHANLIDEAVSADYNQVNTNETQNTESVGAAPQGFDPYSTLQYEHGNQPDRANDARPVNVPQKDTYGRTVTEFAANAYGASVTPDNFVPIIEDLIVDGAMGHDVRTNEESLRAAAAEIKKRGRSGARNAVTKAVMSGKVGENDIATAMLLYAEYANDKSVRGQENAAEVFVDLSQLATRAGRDLQLFKLLRRLTPEGKLMTVQKKVDRFIDGINKTRSPRNQVDVQIPKELLDDYINAVRSDESQNIPTPESNSGVDTTAQTAPGMDATSDAPQTTPEDQPQKPNAPTVDEAEDAIYEFVAAQIPATTKEKWDAWRYMAMLGNPKTQIRNMAGNLMFRPYVSAKNFLAAAAQSIIVKDKEQRTKAILGNSEADQALKAWADNDARRMAAAGKMDYTATTGDSVKDAIEEKRTIFKSKVLESARTGLSDLMGAEDMLFKRWEYKVSLASFLKARGITAEQLTTNQVEESTLEQARAHAVNEAMKATFNDRNAISDFIVNARFKGHNAASRVANAMMEGVLPFRRTPANIVARGLEYSPAGLARGIWNAAAKVKSGEITAADAIDQIAAGVTGTASAVLGYALASGIFGIRLVGGEVDEDERRAGHQAYALEIGGHSYTIDWAAPACLPLLVGANLYDACNPGGEETSVSRFTAFADATLNTLEPMLELSCLSSLNDLLQDARYAEENRELYAIAASMATNYFMQGLPTLFGQVEQTFEDEKKTVYSNNSDPIMRQLERTVGRATQKIPGIDLFQAERLDEWGKPEPEKPVYQRAMEALFSPGYHSEISTDPVEAELSRLNRSQSENVSPSDAAKTLRFTDANGQVQNIRFTSEQWEDLQKTQGQTAHDVVSELIASDDYDLLPDAQKAAAIDNAYAYAREKARVSHVDGYTKMSSKWMEGIEGQEAAVILERAKADASGLSDAQYATAKEQGISFEEMQSVSKKVRAATKPTSAPTTKYDTFRAVLEHAPADRQTAWLKTYGMTDSQLEKASTSGLPMKDYIDTVDVSNSISSAITNYMDELTAGGHPSAKHLNKAYKAYWEMSEEARQHFRDQNGGRVMAFIDAVSNGVRMDHAMDLYSAYRNIDATDLSKSAKANKWAAHLDKDVENGKLTSEQRDIVWESLGYYAQIRQNADKYHDMTGEGLQSDVALAVSRTLAALKPESGKSSVSAVQQFEAIVGMDVPQDQQIAAIRAYGNDGQDKNLEDALAMGLIPQQYVSAYRMYTDASGKGKKARTIQQYQDAFGLDYATAKALYEIYSKA